MPKGNGPLSGYLNRSAKAEGRERRAMKVFIDLIIKIIKKIPQIVLDLMVLIAVYFICTLLQMGETWCWLTGGVAGIGFAELYEGKLKE